jgi:predicted acyl esterase
VHPNYRNDQWRYALHAWFDKHLKQMRVDTGPALEAFLNGERVTTASSWSKPSEYLTLYPSGTALEQAPGDPGTLTFTPRPIGNTSRWLEFATQPLDDETIFLGLSHLRLRASLTSAQVMYLTARVLTRAPDGTETHMATCAIQPQLRNGIERTTPIVPREVMDLELQCFTVAHRARPGDAIVLTIGTTSPHHVPIPWPEAQVTIHTGPDASVLRLPLATGARAFADVPLDE